MTTFLPKDDNDSLYDHPLPRTLSTKETTRKTPTETVLPEEQAIHVDALLDSEETPPPSNSTNSSAVHIFSEDDDVFDSDENQISTSSSSSSTTTVPERPSQDTIPVISSDSVTTNKPAASFLSRASATFYKAFRPKKKPLPQTTPPPSSRDTHVTLAQLFDAQIATLRSARTGFVDLALVTPMTKRSIEAVHEASNLLSDFGQLERNVSILRNHVEHDSREAETELIEKERLLIEAKLTLAQVSEQVDSLRHELRRVQRVLADPNRVDRRKLAQVRREALVCREARRDVERRLKEKRRQLESEKAKLDTVDKDFRDIEGEWA